MHSRRRSIAIAPLIGLALLVMPARAIRAQTSEETDDRVVVLRRLIFDVEARRRVLVKQRGELVALSADQLGGLFASAVLTDELPVDSIAPRVRKIRNDSDFWLSQLKAELASLEGSEGAPRNVLLQWNGAPGTWSMACEGRYPPVVSGMVDQVFMRRPPSGSRGLHVSLYRGRALVTSLNGTVAEGRTSGQQRFEMPGEDFFYDVGTLVWDAQVSEYSPAGDGVEGAIVANGALTYTGNDGRCVGRWQSQ